MMTTNTPVRTVDGLIDALGGVDKVARWAGMANHSAVSHWQTRGKVPPGWHLRLLVECAEREIDVDFTVFGLSPEEARVLRDWLKSAA